MNRPHLYVKELESKLQDCVRSSEKMSNILENKHTYEKQQLLEILQNLVESIGPHWCHVGVVMCSLSANHSSPHSWP